MKKLILIIIVLITVLAVIKPRSAFAQTLSFDPTSGGFNMNQQFTVKINVNTGGQQTTGADALVTFDPTILSIVSATNGGFYTNFANNPISGVSNQYLISGFETDPTSIKSGTGTLATVTFKGIANGTSAVSFNCSAGSKSDSNIIQQGSANDIINCGALASASYTIGPANATPITSCTSTGNCPPTPSTLPRSGTVEVTIAAVGIGIVLTLVGLIFKF